MEIIRQSSLKETDSLGKQRNYGEVVEYLDAHWAIKRTKSLDLMKKLDQALGTPSQKMNTILVGGTNGKSITIHFITKLFKEEGVKIGAFYAPHILTYNERFVIGQETIANKIFTEIANEVINIAEGLGLEAHTSELLTAMALVYFVQQKLEVAVLEVTNGGAYDPANICQAKIVTITRVTETDVTQTAADVTTTIHDIMGIVKKGTAVISGDQNKANLQLMQQLTEANEGAWSMPIRKLAALTYPFEQLHGRCAALAERVSQLYVTQYINKNATVLNGNILSKQKSQRGRPTLEAKKHTELHPQKTLAQFWKETVNELPGRFELLDKEKPSILLDNANSIDAFKNLLLGIRLLHYQRPLKGLTIIVAAAEKTLHSEEFLKLVRYFFKKTSGQLIVCPISSPLPGAREDISWNVDLVTNDSKSLKIKAKACANFTEAFEYSKKSVDERNGLVVVTGSLSIIQEYWQLEGIKRF